MPNYIKYSTTAQTLALKRGNFYIGTGDVNKGPTPSTGYWTARTPPTSGYTIYQNINTTPSIYVCNNDSDLINLTNTIAGQSYTSATQCLVYYINQNDKMCFNIAYPEIVTNGLVLNLDAGFVPSYSRSGTTWSDISLNGNNGTLTNGPSFNSNNNGYIVLDGTDDYVSSNLFLNTITNVTLQCWVEITSTSRKGAFIKIGGGANGYSIGVGNATMDTNGNEIIGLFPNVRWIDTNTTYGTGWKFVTLTLNASSLPTIYLNNTTIGSYSGTNPITPTSGTYIGRNIGDEPSGARAFNGNVAQVFIYNRALSLTEITQNYNATKSRFGL